MPLYVRTAFYADRPNLNEVVIADNADDAQVRFGVAGAPPARFDLIRAGAPGPRDSQGREPYVRRVSVAGQVPTNEIVYASDDDSAYRLYGETSSGRGMVALDRATAADVASLAWVTPNPEPERTLPTAASYAASRYADTVVSAARDLHELADRLVSWHSDPEPGRSLVPDAASLLAGVGNAYADLPVGLLVRFAADHDLALAAEKIANNPKDADR